MKNIKSFALGAVSSVLALTLVGTALAATGTLTITVDPNVKIQVNGQTFQPKDAQGNSVPVFVHNGTTYAPLRALAESYGLEVGYDEKSNMATVGQQESVSQSNNAIFESDINASKNYTVYVYSADNAANTTDLSKANKIYENGIVCYQDSSYLRTDIIVDWSSHSRYADEANNTVKDAKHIQYSGSDYFLLYDISELVDKKYITTDFDRINLTRTLVFNK